jgi:N-acetylmuramoyl-L-alanine amidase
VNARAQRAGRQGALALLAAFCVLSAAGTPAASGATAPPRRSAPSGRPDRALYYEAKAAREALAASRSRLARRAEWDKVVARYRGLVARYPQSPYCDDALLAVGDLYRQMVGRFRSPRLRDEAAAAYRAIVQEYPSSSLAEGALWTVVELAREGGERGRVADAARAYLDAYPRGPRAREAKAALKRSAPEKAAALPAPPPPGLARVFNLRFWSGADTTRVVVDVEKPVGFKHDRIAGPDRLWIDLARTELHPNLKDRSFPVGDGLLEQVRVAQNRDDVVRVVLDFKEVRDYSLFYLQDPTRLVIDVRGSLRPALASAEEADPPPGATSTEAASAGAAGSAPAAAPVVPPSQSPAPAATAIALATPPSPRPVATPAAPTPAPADAPAAADGPAPAPRVALAPRSVGRIAAPEPSPVPLRTPPPLAIDAPAARPDDAPVRAADLTAPPSPPQANRAGSYSLARQLGLGARTIVVDPGHGGHDPGAIGLRGLMEKDLVLDVALRLERLLRYELRAEVIMTRASDVFIPLEERTAIANSRKADLFLSIHANSSRSRTARGVETYFLNFARNRHAEEVAARENAISPATLKDLQGLVKAIFNNSKLDESRDFAASVQEELIGGLRPRYNGALDRGVHTAPLYVLIGANMPSVLAEIAFVSHPEEERLLKTGEYREHVARGLLAGVRSYLTSLNRNHTQKLTSREPAATVAERGRR